jgi:hypothetical protein
MQFGSKVLCTTNTFFNKIVFSTKHFYTKIVAHIKHFFVTLQPISKFICSKHTKIYILWMLYLSTIKSY